LPILVPEGTSYLCPDCLSIHRDIQDVNHFSFIGTSDRIRYFVLTRASLAEVLLADDEQRAEEFNRRRLEIKKSARRKAIDLYQSQGAKQQKLTTDSDSTTDYLSVSSRRVSQWKLDLTNAKTEAALLDREACALREFAEGLIASPPPATPRDDFFTAEAVRSLRTHPCSTAYFDSLPTDSTEFLELVTSKVRRVRKTGTALGLSQILTHCLQPLVECTTSNTISNTTIGR